PATPTCPSSCPPTSTRSGGPSTNASNRSDVVGLSEKPERASDGMNALVYLGPERMEIRDLPDPAPKHGEVLLEVSTAGICGSHIHGFLGHSERRQPGLVMGHETVARVAEVRAQGTPWKAS